jgi:hypothetical protein
MTGITIIAHKRPLTQHIPFAREHVENAKVEGVSANAIRREHGHGHVTPGHFHAAYRSTEFASNRADVEAMQAQDIARTNKRLDLWCRLQPVRKTESSHAVRDHESRLSEQGLRSAMTKGERTEFDKSKRNAKEPTNVLPIRKKKQERPSADDLMKNFSAVVGPSKKP